MTDSPNPGFQSAFPHGPIQEIFPDVYLVEGSIRMAPMTRISRNMVIVRRDMELTLVNPVRLSSEGIAALNALGRVKHLVRLGMFHGIDDLYYKESFEATFWTQANSDHYADPAPDRIMAEGGELPIEDAELFEFRSSLKPESALLLKCNGGILVTCDAIQHYANWDRHSLLARAMMGFMGFSKDTLVGPIWKKVMTPEGASLEQDFNRILELDFKHLVSAHGSLRRDDAHEAVSRAVRRSFSA